MKATTMSLAPFHIFVQRTFLSLLGLVMGSAVLVYLISPRRDPSFVPTSSNAGSLVSWAATIPEATWIWGITVLAMALAVNLALLVPALPFAQRMLTDRGQSMVLTRLIIGIVSLLVCVGLAYVAGLGMLWYLLIQSIVD